MTTWYDPDDAREEWFDAPDDDAILSQLLEVAQDAVIAYAPSLPADLNQSVALPVKYRQAQLMQARNVWNSTEVAPSGEFGEGGFALRPFPLDWQIKQILRPKRAVPRVR